MKLHTIKFLAFSGALILSSAIQVQADEDTSSVIYGGVLAPGAYVENPNLSFPRYDLSLSVDAQPVTVTAVATAVFTEHKDGDEPIARHCDTVLSFPAVGSFVAELAPEGKAIVAGIEGKLVPGTIVVPNSDVTDAAHCVPRSFDEKNITVQLAGFVFNLNASQIKIEISTAIAFSKNSFSIIAQGKNRYDLVFAPRMVPANLPFNFSITNTEYTGPGVAGKTGNGNLLKLSY